MGEASSRFVNEFTLQGLLLGALSAALGVEEPFLVLRVAWAALPRRSAYQSFR
jgi:hypothetical protein